MPHFRAFLGRVYAVGLKPDGDTLAFKPNDPAAVLALPDTSGKVGNALFDPDKNGAVDVRFQGIDALETHYQPNVGDNKPAGASAPVGVSKPSPGNHEQPRHLARTAANAMLGMLGMDVTDADWHSFGYLRRVHVGNRVVEDKFQEDVDAFVVANDVDSNGRVLGWIFPGTAPLTEGATLTEEELVPLVKQSLNGQLAARGHAYPYFYLTLSSALRGRVAYYAALAQRYRRGLWASDPGTSPLPIATLSDLHSATLWPYLFRKTLKSWRMDCLEAYWSGGDVSAAALEKVAIEHLFATGNPYIYLVQEENFVRLSEVLKVENGTIQLLKKTQDIVFLD